MTKVDHFDGLRAWLELQLGYDLSCVREDDVLVISNSREEDEPLLAYRIGERSVVRVRQEWMADIAEVVSGLALDELFSIFGCYELARVTLADNVSVWGPSWYLFGDENCFVHSPSDDVIQLDESVVSATDNLEVFWHCGWQEAEANFGVVDGDRLIALASVRYLGSPVYEIEVDVAPKSGGRGLGRAVVSAAGRWILDQGGLILARTAQWNVPSARLLRSVGLQYVLCDLVGKCGSFRVPPQPLGKPLPDVEICNLYPDWGMNRDIQKR